jgi:acyl dehydratase
MTVKTVVQTIGSAYVQISDGTQTKALQVLGGVVSMVDADSQPPSNANGHLISKWITITPPTQAWVAASSGDTARIAVS